MYYHSSMLELLEYLFSLGYKLNLSGNPNEGFTLSQVLLPHTEFDEYFVYDLSLEQSSCVAAVRCANGIMGIAIYGYK